MGAQGAAVAAGGAREGRKAGGVEEEARVGGAQEQGGEGVGEDVGAGDVDVPGRAGGGADGHRAVCDGDVEVGSGVLVVVSLWTLS